MLKIFASIVGAAIALFARFVTALRGVWRGVEPIDRQRIYFANHTSNGDFVMVWTALPAQIRAHTRPVAASDYWLKSKLRAFVGRDVFKAVLIDRRADKRTDNPVEKMIAALDEGSSLIIFPEGGRNMGPDPILPFKTGLFHMGAARPKIDMVPVWIENLNSILPKGEVVPLPLICTVTFGAPIHVKEGETKESFLSRAESALVALAPKTQEGTA
ncbi:acyl-phosphate glycerol 3-phosphate acyltransferase [Amylibacter kogurei]|uniref:Acyl-phosphate glycerol 3-phosphate acyltransferase n=1 Tax=Paramylibacter kogurei TaxID=1889778 RepID=A0A2G5K2W4_9RHOB|nr:lysophospholipid acyltransferase family protein [Amylibacter kogurei]PIB23459.1 acyl-phosphate glycerol 3-phosphate acyltransferase [Amylibacter kogurei]